MHAVGIVVHQEVQMHVKVDMINMVLAVLKDAIMVEPCMVTEEADLLVTVKNGTVVNQE